MKYENVPFSHISMVLAFLCIIGWGAFITSCTKNTAIVPQDSVTTDIITDSESASAKDLEALSITHAYIMPDPVEGTLLNTIPETVQKRTDTHTITKEIISQVEPKEELRKYLEQKRQYAKTSIFANVP